MKAQINLWKEDLQPSLEFDKPDLIKNLESCNIEIQEASLSDDSEEVAFTIAGYVAKKLMKHRKCKLCDVMLLGNE